ncbi:hypothetical protein [Reichenbachiella ulvae]|uniref:Uncharacterized protein n=1 Tax=Reichenbachiella ulvae TaxID=2980104 RepID=A0ABT3CYW1_9BACT|nr:hypothetical protein [Reichenbachiella ulvae]MCV9388885.1 hypothetical protein [Reichenbachiella ulvae]
MSTATVRVKYDGSTLSLSNDGSTWSSDCSFLTNVSPNGKIEWVTETNGLTITNIEITVNNDKILKKSPYEQDGVWYAKIKDKDSGRATYVIQYSVNGVEQPEFDPEMIIKRT